jgi:hypothetical protein
MVVWLYGCDASKALPMHVAPIDMRYALWTMQAYLDRDLPLESVGVELDPSGGHSSTLL